MKISDFLPPRVGFAGPRSLGAFIALLALGIIFYIAGVVTSGTTAKGVGAIFSFIGLGGAVAILLRWLIYRKIG